MSRVSVCATGVCCSLLLGVVLAFALPACPPGGSCTGSLSADTSGNIGIKGSPNASYALTVYGSLYTTGFTLPTGAMNGYVLTANASGTASWAAPTGGVTGSGTATYLPLWTNTTVLGNSVIYQNGTSVGIGTTLAAYTLDVTGTLRVTATTTHTGNVGIGTAAPAYPLDVVGNARFSGGTIFNKNTSTYWSADGTSWNIFYTPYGGIELGPANGSYAHIYSTNNLPFYFNTAVYTAGGAYYTLYTGSPGWGGSYIGFANYQGDLPGYPNNSYPLIKTDASYTGFSIGGYYSSYITTGGAWNAVSSKARKKNFQPIDYQTILDKIDAMPVMQWSYKEDPVTNIHIGPFAEDFHDAFGLNGTDSKTIGNLDISGVEMAGIKGLIERDTAQQKQIEELTQTVRGLQSRVDAMEQTIQTLQSRIPR